MSTLHDDTIDCWKGNTKVFLETGSWRGESITRALKHGFEKVISIELARNWYDHCYGKFKDNPKVNLVYGDSAKCLWDCIKDVFVPIFFWIDAHKSDSNTAQSDLGAPIPHELKQIARHPIKSHTILIDDMDAWIKKPGGFPFGDQEIMQWLKEINPDYKFAHEDGKAKSTILVAYL